MKMTKRILSFVLCLAMIVGIIPMSVFAADEVVLDAAIFCSDVHGSTSDLSSVLAGVKTSGVDYSSIGFVGDTCLTVANTTSTVQSALGDTDIAVMFSYAASHDTEDGADISTNWDYSGEVEGVSNYYLVYTIRETDMQNASGASTAAPAFTTWYNGLTAAEKALPIFIMSHRPLHDRRDDNAGAATWYTAISAAAETSDIVFFWGHNHTGDNSVDQAAYYVAKDGTETFTVYNGDTVVPNFTYMNAGYINANGQNPARKGIATTVQITASSLIFQDYNSSGEYSGTYAHNVTLEREFAPEEEATPVLPSKLEVTGTTEYDLGATFVTPTVTVRYTDDTTKEVTDYEVSGTYDMNTVGTYTLTYTYTEAVDGQNYQATAEFTFHVVSNMKTVTAFDQFDNISVSATAENLTGITVTNVTGDLALFDEVFTDHLAVTVALTGHTSGNSVQYSIPMADHMDTTNLELYYLSGEELVPVEYELITDAQGNQYVKFTTTYVGTFVYGSPNVPDGYTLSKVEVSGIPADLFVGTSLDLTEAVITATYTKEGAENFVRVLTIYDYDETNFSGLDVNVAGKQAVTFTFENVSAEPFNVYVWGKTFVDDATDVTVTVGDSEHGVNNVTVEKLNEDLSDALQYVIAGDNYVAYEIGLGFADNYATKNEQKTVTLPIPEGVTNPVVYYVFADRSQVSERACTISEDGKYITFTTTHFSTYVVGEGLTIETESGNATVEGSSITTTKDVWVKVDAPADGGQYLIVSTGTAGTAGYIMGGSSVTPVSGTLTVNGTDGTYTYFESTGTVWTASGSGTSWSFKNSSNGYLGYTYTTTNYGSTYYSYTLSTSATEAVIWSLNNNQLYKNLIYRDRSYSSDTYYDYFISGGSSWSMDTDEANVYFYEKKTVSITTGEPGHTYSAEGKDITNAAAIKGQTVELSSQLFDTPDGGTATDITASSGLTPTYELVTTKGNPAVISGIENGVATLSGVAGTAVVKVTYTSGDLVAWDEFTVTAATPHHYSIELYKHDGSNPTEEITAPVALKNVKAGDTYSVWAVVKAYASADDTVGTDLGTLGDALTWSVSNEAIATIDTKTGVITFTGNNFGTFDVTVKYTGADGVNYEDTITISATESQYVVPGDGTNDFPEYPNQGAIRFDKTATAVGNFSETGIAKVEISMTGVPYTKGNELDVVLVLDMTGSMDDVSNSSSEPTGYTRVDATIASAKAFIKSIVINEDGTYNDNRIGIYVFNKNGASTLYDLATINTDAKLQALIGKIADGGTEFDSNYTEGKLDTIWKDYGASGGTPYDDGLAKAQSVLTTAKTDGTGNDRQQFCVFMTDGVPTSYAYVNGTTYGTHSSASAIAGMLTSASDYATRDTDYKYEYYSTEMKKAGVTVYSVGVGLFNENNAWSGSATQCGNLASALLNDISGPANETTQPDAVSTSTLSKKDSYFFSVDDADAGTEMTKIFSNIAQKIVEAAKNVVVEDKIGNKYNINFALPDGLTSVDTDGLKDFYIQVVEYQLNENKERTGDPTVLENFTFNGETGALISHTVDGVVTCEGDACTHVTMTGDNVTAINGTYFSYETKTEIDKETGKEISAEYLFWKSEKIGSTELAMQYFAYLEGSAGYNGTDATPAGTYYTNEYATLTYTNFQGKEVQQKFPVPQMTWNGAQVSYVFYLVNEQGQPVNRQGRVVPFTEAVYITDVYTMSVMWNTLEQAAGLEASHIASELVPDVFELYDADASYRIHVYEDESAVNLNNHFVIGGSASVNTTYVFNVKSDANKYKVPGTYVADDGDSDSSETGLTYFCKSAIVEGATWTSRVENGVTVYTVTSVGEGYQKIDGETQTTVATIESAGGSTTGGTIIGDYIYYVDENGDVYTIVTKKNGQEVHKGFDFANTTVAFAVVWTPGLKEDTVVVDFGLDVVIDVITNDIMIPGIVGLSNNPVSGSEQDITPYDQQQMANTPIDLKIGDLKIGTAALITNDNAHIRVTFDKTNGMQFNQPVSFYYEAKVEYYDNNVLVTKYMYSKVTVIPATTVYYEDSFVTFETDNWSVDGTAANKTQNQDRPGESKISADLDADNNYGYDSAYTQMSKYSLGSAHKATVSADSYAVAVFTFYGTGFDIISLTSNTTGTIFVDVYEGAYAKQSDIPAEIINSPAKSFIVDTYYGYAYQSKDMNGDGVVSEGEGEWAITSNTPNSLYQVPVIKVSGLDYKQYTVVICAAYDKFFDHNGTGSYDFYLDAIRIYDPTGVASGDSTNDIDSVVSGAYEADGEGWPTYFEVRDQIIAKDTFDSLNDEEISGIVFMDGGIAEPSIENYISYGPNNELYLADGQAIAFDLNATATAGDVAKVQLAVKTVGGSGKIEVYGVNADGSRIDCLATAVATATDMYYDITALNGKTVVIKNVGSEDDAIISITNVKVTYTEAQPETSEEPAVLMFSIRRSTANAALATMSVEEETVPEETVPEETVPEETVPEETVPEETVPEEPEIFTPEQLKIELSKGKVKEGDKVKVTVKTSGDVAYIVVNGEVVADYRSNRRTGERTWTVTVEAEEAGELEIEVVAYNAEDVASEAVTETVTVEAKKNPAKVVKDILKGVLGWLFG